jgi:membrane fusion protein, multidrug efflux system
MAGNKQPSVSESTQDPADLVLKEPPQRLGTWKIATIPLRFMLAPVFAAAHLVRRALTHQFSPRARATTFLLLISLLLAAWWMSGYVFAYTDDAYITSDIVSITPEVSGLINAIYVTDNEWVARGTVLFTIDPTPFELEVQRARALEAEAEAQLPVDQADLENLKAQHNAAKAAATVAATNLGRDKKLASNGWVSQQALDTSVSTQQQTSAQMKAAQAATQSATQTLQLHQVAVASAQAARRLAEWRLSRTRVVAPVDGYVTNLTLRVGDMATTDKALVAVVDGNAWRVIANYKEYYLRHLTPGHEAWVWLDTRPWHLYRARIQGLAHGISRQQGDSELVPFVSPTVDWIRLQRRIPVRLTLLDAKQDDLFMGADARTLVIY